MIALDQATYLGPATVLSAAAGRIKLELPDEHAWALSALAFPYQPEVGDLVLAVGKEGQWYVIGVLKGSGTTTLLVPGDLAIAAPRGRVSIQAGHGVEIRGPHVTVKAGRLQLSARTIVERFDRATRWIKNAFQLRAGRMRTRVDTTYDVAAQNIREHAGDDVKIDGRQIHLG